MKRLLRETMAIFMSLTLLFGLLAPTMVAKASVFKDGLMTFADNDVRVYSKIDSSASGEDGIKAKLNGYDFNLFTNGNQAESYFIVEDNYLIHDNSKFLFARSIGDVHFDKLYISLTSGNGIDLSSITIGATDVYSDFVTLILTGMKDGNPVPGATVEKMILSNNFGDAEFAFFDVSEMGEFSDIDGFTITPGEFTTINTFIIKSIDANEIPRDTGNTNPDTGNPGTGGQEPSNPDPGTPDPTNPGTGNPDPGNPDTGITDPVNEAPTANNVMISEDYGNLAGSYTYLDNEDDIEGKSLFKWYRYDDPQGTNETLIYGYNGKSYPPSSLDYGKYLRFEVEPVAQTGTTQGIPVKSDFYGPIGGNPSIIDLDGLKHTIESYRGGTGTFTAQVDQEAKTITVTGEVTNAREILTLPVPGGVTIIWKAFLSDSTDFGQTLIELEGEGRFILAEGGHIIKNGGYAAIRMRQYFASIVIDEGRMETESIYGIEAEGTTSEIIVLSGRITSTGGTTIRNPGLRSVTWIKGGRIKNSKDTTIYSGGLTRVTGGVVQNASHYAIHTSGNVIVEDTGAVVAGLGLGIFSNKFDSSVTLDGGIVFSYYSEMWGDDAIRLIDNPEGLTINDDGAIVKWDYSTGKETYTEGSSEDIITIPDNINAYWSNVEGEFGIIAEKGQMAYFFPISLVSADPGTGPGTDPVYVESFEVKTPPTKSAYYIGEALELSGLVVTLHYSDGSSKDVAYEDFEANGLSTNPEEGRIVESEMSMIIISHKEGKIKKDIYFPMTIKSGDSYSIFLKDNGHGTASANVLTAQPGTEITLTATPDPGYKLASWDVIEGNITIHNNKFIMGDGSVMIRAIFEKVGDVPPTTETPPSTEVPSSTETKPTTGVEHITVDVKEGSSDSVAAQISIERTTKQNGQKSDKVFYDNDKAIETVRKLISGGMDTARIVIPDEKDEVSETTVTIPVLSMKTLAEGKINLQIDTQEAKIFLSKDSVHKMNAKMKDDLYFHLVPVKDKDEKEAVKAQAKQKAAQITKHTNSTVAIVGNPVTIETNMPSAETDIILPLSGIVIPENKSQREALLKQLAVYIEHSDGDKELVQGDIVEYKDSLYGIRFHINKFSTFTVVKTNAFLESADKDIIKISTPGSAVLKGNVFHAVVANAVTNLTVKATVSDKATYQVYLDKELKKEAKKNKLILKTGVNTSYIKVTAEDKTTKVYQLSIKRNKSAMADITKLIVPDKAVIKSNTIMATVSNDKSSLSVKALVSSKASYKLYTDKALKKVIKHNKLDLAIGTNTVYLKVTAENGKSSKVYTLTITREAKKYNTHVRLGVIGSKTYAEKVANIFEKEYDTANVRMKPVGKYYLVTMDFKNVATANKACKDMIDRGYIINYYIN